MSLGEDCLLSHIRFIVSAVTSVGWFIVASLISFVDALRHDGDRDLTHRYASLLSRGFVRTLHLVHRVENRERLMAVQPCVYLANHRSNMDVPVLCGLFPPGTVIIGKRAVLRIPLLGFIFKRGRNIDIDRSNKIDSYKGIGKAEKAITEEKLSVWVFPEGTRNFGTMKKFKKGAFHMARNTGVPLVPMVCAVPKGWVNGARMYLAKRNTIAVRVLEPIDPARFGSVDDLIDYTWKLMKSELEALEATV